MKIIKKGIQPEKVIINHVCKICKTEFEFERWEADFSCSPKNESFLIINCPLCKEKLYIDY